MSITLFSAALLSAPLAGTAPLSACAKDVGATSSVSRVADLPPEVRSDLRSIAGGEMADSSSEILRTDAPRDADRDLATSRFLQAILVKDAWYVSYEVAMSVPRTMGYFRRAGGRFERSPFHHFAGPPCEAVKAAIRGVTSLPPA